MRSCRLAHVCCRFEATFQKSANLPSRQSIRTIRIAPSKRVQRAGISWSAARTMVRARAANTPRWPRFLGLRVVIAQSFAQIHWQNLINFGDLPLTFADPGTWHEIAKDDILAIIKYSSS